MPKKRKYVNCYKKGDTAYLYSVFFSIVLKKKGSVSDTSQIIGLMESFSYSPYYNSTRNYGDVELFPQMNSAFDFTLEDPQDKPQSTWSLQKIGLLQSQLEKRTLMKRNINLAEMVSLCNNVFGYDGWRTEVVDIELMNYEEIQENDNEEASDEQMEDEVRYDKDGLVIIHSQRPMVRYSLEIKTTVKLILKDGTYHEASGVGKARRTISKSTLFTTAKRQSLSLASKNAILDLKHVLESFESKRDSGFYVT